MKDNQTIFGVALGWLLLGYCTALWQFPDVAHLGMSALFALAIWDLQTRRAQPISIKFKQPDALAGATLVVLLGLLNLKLNSFYLIRMTPWLGGIALVLLGFGRTGLRLFRKELALLFFLGMPSILAQFLPDPSPLAAQFGGALLHLVGVDVLFTEGTHLVLPTGAVQVFRGCSGLEYMTYLLGLAVLCLTIFPLSGQKRYWVPLLGVVLGFVVNGFRVALLAILASQNNMNSFDYWHEGPGSLLFGGGAVVLFGLLYSLMLRNSQKYPYVE